MSYGKSSCRSLFPSFWPVFARRSSSISERRQSDRPLALYRSARLSSRDYRRSNPAYVLEGATVVALLAMAVDRWFAWLEDCARPGATPSRNGSRPLIRPLAQIGNEAARAFRAPRLADIASMQNQPMMRMQLEPGGNDRLQPAFDFERRLTRGQGNPVRDAENMRVDGDHAARRKQYSRPHWRSCGQHRGAFRAPRGFVEPPRQNP